jgi:hypothetical protein
MWKVTSVQVSNERGTIASTLGTMSRFAVSDGWTITVEDREVIVVKDDDRLRIPRGLVVIHETREPTEPATKPAKRSREAA